jgi:hypothetical protein
MFLLAALLCVAHAWAQPLPSWNEGPTKQGIVQELLGCLRQNGSTRLGRPRGKAGPSST